MAKTDKAGSADAAVPAVAETANTAVALQDQFLSDGSGGFEEADAQSYAIPFLVILQSGSPQCKRSDGAYVEGAQEGDLFNTVTNQLYKNGVVVIPCHYSQRYIEWKLREKGGGFVRELDPSDPEVQNVTRDDKGRNITPAGTQLVDTRNHYVMIFGEDGSLTPAILSMTSTQLKKSRQWMSQMQGTKMKNPATGMFETAPMYSRKYKLTTVPESNDKGSWFGFKVELIGVVDDLGMYSAAKAFHQSIRQGRVTSDRKATEMKTAEETAF